MKKIGEIGEIGEIEDIGEYRLEFGKYRGKSFKYVCRNYSSYVAWIIENIKEPSKNVRDFIYYFCKWKLEQMDYLEYNINHVSLTNKEEQTFKFGKYKGKSFKYVCNNYLSYVAWVIKLPNPTEHYRDFIAYFYNWKLNQLLED